MKHDEVAFCGPFFLHGEKSIFSIFMTWADLFNNEDTVVLTSRMCPFTLGTNWICMKYFNLFIKT